MSKDCESKRKVTGDYSVGYCRPPKTGQWKPGQSGNPKGRSARRLSGDVAECMNYLLEETRWVEINGKRQLITNADGLARVRLKEAFDSKSGAVRDVYRWQQDHFQRNPLEQETVIECELVFPEEDYRLVRLAQENNELRERIKRLESKLGATSAPRLLSGPARSE